MVLIFNINKHEYQVISKDKNTFISFHIYNIFYICTFWRLLNYSALLIYFVFLEKQTVRACLSHPRIVALPVIII